MYAMGYLGHQQCKKNKRCSKKKRLQRLKHPIDLDVVQHWLDTEVLN